MRWIPARGKSVRRLLGNHPEFRHRQPHASYQIMDDGADSRINVRILGGTDRLRRIHRQRDLLREEVAEEIHECGDSEAYVETVFARNRSAAHHENSAQKTQ